jgi:hypothetical protein
MKGSPSPFLTLSMRNFLMFGQMSEPQAYTKNLLALARHYDVPRDDELSQVARKMGIGNNGDVLKVGTFWTFTIGPGMTLVSLLDPLPSNAKLTTWLSRHSHHS